MDGAPMQMAPGAKLREDALQVARLADQVSRLAKRVKNALYGEVPMPPEPGSKAVGGPGLLAECDSFMVEAGRDLRAAVQDLGDALSGLGAPNAQDEAEAPGQYERLPPGGTMGGIGRYR